MQIDKRMRAWILAGICILPYIETGVLRTILSYKSTTVYWRSITSFLLIGLIFCIVRSGRITNLQISKKSLVFFLLFVLIYVRSLIRVDSVNLAVINQIFMLILPILFSGMCIESWEILDISTSYIIKRLIYVYTLFVVATIFININRYGMSISSITQFRLTASGGGSVPYGLSIALVYALFVKYRYMFSRLQSIAISAIFLFASALNQSRVGIMVCLFLSFYQFLFQRNIYTRIIGWSVFCGIAMILFSNTEQIIAVYFPRLLDTKSSRTDTWMNCLKLIIVHPEKLLYGYGVNGFFKYQNWQATVDVNSTYSDINYGTFMFENMRFLVQPHNSFLYLLIEYGIGGLFFLVDKIYCICKNRIICFEDIIVPVVFVIINLFDSIIVAEPGTAFLWWYVLRISVLESKELEVRYE